MVTERKLTFLFLYVFLQPCVANISCAVSVDQTIYNISDVPQDSDCDYSWTSTGNLVLANNIGENSTLVRNKSISFLVTATCFDKVNYTRRCVSEGTEYSKECTCECRGPASLEDKPDGRINGHYGWIPATVLVLLLIGSLAYYVRQNIKK